MGSLTMNIEHTTMFRFQDSFAVFTLTYQNCQETAQCRNGHVRHFFYFVRSSFVNNSFRSFAKWLFKKIKKMFEKIDRLLKNEHFFKNMFEKIVRSVKKEIIFKKFRKILNCAFTKNDAHL